MDTSPEPKSDVSAESSPAPTADVKPAEQPSLKEFVRQGLDKSDQPKPAEEAPVADESAASDTASTDETEQTDESAQTESEELKVDETKPIPYNRFKEVNTQKNEAIAKLKDLEPKLQQYEATFNDPNVRAALDVLQLINSNPAKALEQLTPIVEHLKQVQGEALPKDLAEAVAEGVMDPKYAKELSMLRLKQNMTAKQLEQQQQNVATQAQKAVFDAWTAWDLEHRKTDPDLQPGSEKWNLVDDLLTAEKAKNGFPTTPAQAIAMVEAAYAKANGYRKQATKAPRKILTSTNTSSIVSEPDPAKMDAHTYIQAMLARKKS